MNNLEFISDVDNFFGRSDVYMCQTLFINKLKVTKTFLAYVVCILLS